MGCDTGGPVEKGWSPRGGPADGPPAGMNGMLPASGGPCGAAGPPTGCAEGGTPGAIPSSPGAVGGATAAPALGRVAGGAACGGALTLGGGGAMPPGTGFVTALPHPIRSS